MIKIGLYALALVLPTWLVVILTLGPRSSGLHAFAAARGGSVVIRVLPQLKPLYCGRLKEWLDANEPGTVFWNRNSLIWGDNCA